MALSLEIQQMKDAMKKEYSLLDGLDDDERQLVIDKAMVFKKVIQSQRHMKEFACTQEVHPALVFQ